MNEVWKDVVGFEELFSVSNTGRLQSKRTGKLLKQNLAKSGYLTVATKVGGRSGKSYCFRLHRLVAEAFLDKPFESAVVNHINGCKSDNHVNNLEWVSQGDNVRHAFATGLNKPHAAHTARKLTSLQVLCLKTKYSEGKATHRQLAKEFGIDHSTVGRILREERYIRE